MKPLKQCNHAGCNALIPYDQRYCSKHQREINKYRYHKRQYASNESKYQQFYKSTAWRKLSRHWLEKNPICVKCYKQGIIRPAQIVDHITEIKDDWSKRLDASNLQSLCRVCHNHKTAIERRKRAK